MPKKNLEYFRRAQQRSASRRIRWWIRIWPSERNKQYHEKPSGDPRAELWSLASRVGRQDVDGVPRGRPDPTRPAPRPRRCDIDRVVELGQSTVDRAVTRAKIRAREFTSSRHAPGATCRRCRRGRLGHRSTRPIQRRLRGESGSGRAWGFTGARGTERRSASGDSLHAVRVDRRKRLESASDRVVGFRRSTSDRAAIRTRRLGDTRGASIVRRAPNPAPAESSGRRSTREGATIRMRRFGCASVASDGGDRLRWLPLQRTPQLRYSKFLAAALRRYFYS